MDRIVLAYSGGLDTSIAIPWLQDAYGAEIVAVTVDLGQGAELEEIRDRALAAGAARAHVIDAREEFALEYVAPALRADASHEARGSMSHALGQALIAKKLVDLAAFERASAVAHGCHGGCGLPVPLEAAAASLAPDLPIIALARGWTMTPAEKIAYARQRGIRVPAASDATYRTEANLWERSMTLVAGDDPWVEPPEHIYTLTIVASACPDEAAYVELSFIGGTPTAINGVSMPLVDLIASLNTIAGRHGIGRIDVVQDVPGRSRSRTIREAPAAELLRLAHQDLQAFVVSSDLHHVCRMVSRRYADMIDAGLWFTPTRQALDAFVGNVQARVNGAVRLKLFKGNCRIVGRTPSPAADDRAGAVSLVDDGRRLVTM